MNGSLIAKPSDLIKLVPFALFPFSYASWSISSKEEVAVSAIYGAAIACVGGLLIAIVQAVFYPDLRVEGGAGNALVFAALMVIAVSVVVAGLLLNATDRPKVLAIAARAGAAALLMSQSRTPLALIAVNILLLVVIFGSAKARIWGIPIGLACIAAVGAALLAGMHIPVLSSRIQATMENLARMRADGNYNSSLGIRLAIWDIGLDMWRDAPWFGHGRVAGAQEMVRRIGSEYGIQSTFTHFHNFIVQALVQGGVLLLASIAALFAYATRLALATISATQEMPRRFGAALMLIAVITYLGAGMTNIMFGHDILDAMFMVLMVPGVYLAAGRSMAKS